MSDVGEFLCPICWTPVNEQPRAARLCFWCETARAQVTTLSEHRDPGDTVVEDDEKERG